MKLINDDCLKAMKEMFENSVDSIVTDPPYELGFMGKSWDSSGIAFNVEVWQEALRVLKPGGYLLAFSGSRTYHRMAVAIEDAGFEIRDQIQWIYGSGFPKSHNLKGNWQGWGTALKPAHEPIVLARKTFTGTVANNVLKHGTGALNIDKSRIEIAEGDEPKAGNRTATFGTQETVSGGDGSGGWEPSTGRWPANVIHDGSDEVVALFPDTGKSTGGRIGKKTMGDVTNVPAGEYEAGDPGYGDSGSAARFFYCAKTSKKDRNEGLDGFQTKEKRYRATANGTGKTSKGMERFTTLPSANYHPTVKPTDLMQYLCRLVTPLPYPFSTRQLT